MYIENDKRRIKKKKKEEKLRMRAKKILILSMALVVFISQSSLASEIDDLLAPVNLKAQRHENEDNKYSNRKRTKPHVITSGGLKFIQHPKQ